MRNRDEVATAPWFATCGTQEENNGKLVPRRYRIPSGPGEVVNHISREFINSIRFDIARGVPFSAQTCPGWLLPVVAVCGGAEESAGLIDRRRTWNPDGRTISMARQPTSLTASTSSCIIMLHAKGLKFQ